jgi:phage gpG-like protein
VISPAEFARLIDSAALRVKTEMAIPTLEVVEVAAEFAKSAIGGYSLGWPPLQPDTIARKSTGDSPLLESGELRDSITAEAELTPFGAEGAVGSNDPIAVFHEAGTSRVPPRPLYGASLLATAPEAEAIFTRFAAKVFDQL